MQRAAIYVRMSTDKQEDSPERQRGQIDPHCERKGYVVVRRYEDLGERGWSDERPQFNQMLADAHRSLFDVIVVDEMSRLSRSNPWVFMDTVASPLRKAEVVVDSVSEGLIRWDDPDDICGYIMLGVRQHKSSQESATLGRRVATRMVQLAKDARMFPGRPLYGYRFKKDANGNRVGLEVDTDHPERAEVVRRVFAMYLEQDVSVAGIVAELNVLNIPTPSGRGQWGKNTVMCMLKNPGYAGRYAWGRVSQGQYFRCVGDQVVATTRNAKAPKSTRRPAGEYSVVPDHHEPIIAPADFERVQERLATNRPRTSPSRKRGVYPFSQKLVCVHCGRPMYGTMRPSGGKKEPVYRCGSDMSNGACAPRVVRERVVLDQVAEVLQTRLLDPAERERLIAELRRQHEAKGNKNEQAVKDLQRTVARLDVKIAKATENLLLLDAKRIRAAQDQLNQWERERAMSRAELDRLSAEAPAGSPEWLVTRVEKLVEVMRTGDPALVRPVVQEAIGRIELRFDTVQKPKVMRYPLAGGVVHLVGCADLDRSGPGAGR